MGGKYFINFFQERIIFYLNNEIRTTLIKLISLKPSDQLERDLFAQLFGLVLTVLVPPTPRNA